MSTELPIKVYVVLISGNSNRSGVFTVRRDSVSDVDDLCDQVKVICSTTLAQTERFSLEVFSNEEGGLGIRD